MDLCIREMNRAANHVTMGISLLLGCICAAIVTTVIGAPPIAVVCLLAALGAAFFVACQAYRSSHRASDLQAQLDHLDRVDYATGLPNRNALMDFLNTRLDEAEASGDEVILTRLNLDSFGQVNDAFGTKVADELIVAVARRLRGLVPEGDLVARLNGDSFAVVSSVPACRKGRHEALPQRLLKAFEDRFAYSGGAISLSASIGYAVATPDVDAPTLFREAGWAEREAKRAGKNRVRTIDKGLESHANDLVALEADLREAIAEGSISVHFQPQVDSEGRLFAFEALARWQREPGVFVRPDEFFAVAHRLGLSSRLGEHVLRKACAILGQWQSDFGVSEQLAVSVNFGAEELRADGFVDMVRAVIDHAEIRPHNLIIELSDANTRRGFEPILAVLQELRDDGVNIALDNFGESIFALNNLAMFPVNMVKLDRHLVANVLVDEESRALFEYLVSIADQTVNVIIAEGVESEEQQRFVFDAGVDAAQGFHVAIPMDAGSVAEDLPAKPPSKERIANEFAGFGTPIVPKGPPKPLP